MAATASPIDTRIEIVTPENIAFEYRLAGPFQRLPAYLVDVLIQATVIGGGFLLLLITMGIARLPGLGFGLGLVLFFVVQWFYGGLFESLWNGQTPGKRLFRLRVLSADGQPINALQAVLRNILRTVDALPGYTAPGGLFGLFFWQVGFLSAATTERFARVGDLACGTMVVVEEPHYVAGAMRVTEAEALALAAQLPAGLTVSRSLAQALSAYVARRRMLPWARRVQIAQHVGEPLRERFGLPWGTSYDLLLCAVYQRAFFSDPETSDTPALAAVSGMSGAVRPTNWETAGRT